MRLEELKEEYQSIETEYCKDCGADDLTELNCYGCPYFGRKIDIQMEMQYIEQEADNALRNDI